MKRFVEGGLVVIAAAVGIWGCTQTSSEGTNASADKIKTLENNLVQLEDENRSVTAARDQLRKKLAETEEQRLQLQHEIEQLQAVAKERDELKEQLVARTAERDNLQNQFDQMRKALRGILNQADAANATLVPRTVPTRTTSQQGKL
jgi:chromosome segregation ATPase